MIEKAASRLGKTIDSLGCLQVAKIITGDTEISYLCRWTNEPKWLEVLEFFLQHEKGWKSFFAKNYFLKNEKMVVGWYLAFRAEDLETAAEKIGALLIRGAVYADGGVPTSNGASADLEVLEVHLSNSTDRNQVNSKGKGVQWISR